MVLISICQLSSHRIHDVQNTQYKYYSTVNLVTTSSMNKEA